jgi:hypothetical protein
MHGVHLLKDSNSKPTKRKRISVSRVEAIQLTGKWKGRAAA